jgi:hypothetical protein
MVEAEAGLHSWWIWPRCPHHRLISTGCTLSLSIQLVSLPFFDDKLFFKTKSDDYSSRVRLCRPDQSHKFKETCLACINVVVSTHLGCDTCVVKVGIMDQGGGVVRSIHSRI